MPESIEPQESVRTALGDRIAAIDSVELLAFERLQSELNGEDWQNFLKVLMLYHEGVISKIDFMTIFD